MMAVTQLDLTGYEEQIDALRSEDAYAQQLAAIDREILNLELKIRPHGDRCALDLYSGIPLEQYFRKAYENACRVVGDYFRD